MGGVSCILLSGLSGAFVGASAALASQFLAHHLAQRRELLRFRIQSFERFRREFSEDDNLRRIDTKKGPFTDDEIDDYLGFFEETRLYFDRGLVDIQLVDEILGDSIVAAWEDQTIREAVGAIRGGEDDPTYFKYFERLARHLIGLRNKRIGKERQ